MSKITISFECQKNPFYHGKDWFTQIGDHVITAPTKAELQVKVEEFLMQQVKTPKVELAKVGDDILIAVEHGGNTDTYRPTVKGTNGVIPLTLTCSSNRGAYAEANANARHLYEGAWDRTNPSTEVLTNISPSEKENFRTWVKYQRQMQQVEALQRKHYDEKAAIQ